MEKLEPVKHRLNRFSNNLINFRGPGLILESAVTSEELASYSQKSKLIVTVEW